MSWIIDGHLDLAHNAMALGRDLRAPLDEIRQREGASPAHGNGLATVSLPALRAARVRVALATLFQAPARHGDDGSSYRSPEGAYRQAMAQIAYYRALQAQGEVTLVRARAELDRAAAGKGAQPGLVLLLEGAEPIRTPDDLAAFAEEGVRVIGLSWRATRYAGAAGDPGPLTPAGSALLRAMAQQGIALDLSHLAEAACRQALRIFTGPVVASHANCRAIVPSERQLSDEFIREIAARDSVVGLVCYNRFLRPDWSRAHGKAAVSLADLAAHARHIADLVGARHIALGSDLDGGIGRDDAPAEIESVSDLPAVSVALADAGFTRDEIAGIMHGNWLRVLRTVITYESENDNGVAVG